jgi:hypothetical protein
MKKFILKYIIFVLPILIPLVLLEVCIRNIPNDYSYKNHYMSSHAASIETLILGSSHTYLGVNPEFIDSKSFNLSHLGETIEYDVRLFDKFKANLENLKIVVLPISYYHLYNRGINKRWIKNYNLYYDFNDTDFLVDNLEVLNENWIDLIKDSYSYYYLNKPSPYLKLNTLGWLEKMKANVEDYNLISKKMAKLHTKTNFTALEYNISVLEAFSLECQKMGVEVLFVTLPVHSTYKKALNVEQLKLTRSSAQGIASDFNNVGYYNFMDSELFEESDFRDADHLNALGAEKFSIILNDIINKKLNSNE